MRFPTLALIPLLAVSVSNVLALTTGPSPATKSLHSVRSPDLESRGCETCDHFTPSSGGDSVNFDVFTDVQLTYLTRCTDSFVEISSAVNLAVEATTDIRNKVLSVALSTVSWSISDVTTLVNALTALEAKLSGKVDYIDDKAMKILTKALIDINSITVTEVTCVKIFVSNVVAYSINLTVEAKKAIFTWCYSIVSYAVNDLVCLKSQVNATVQYLYQTITDVKVKLLAEVETFCKSKDTSLSYTLFSTILNVVRAWVGGSINQCAILLAVLKLNFKTSLELCNLVTRCLAPYGFKSSVVIDAVVWGRVVALV